MRKLLYILPVLLILGFAACENYVDITPTGKKTVDSTETYYELVALPNRSYYPSSFALLSDNVWSKESNIIGKEYLSSDGINMTFNEDADRKELSDNNLYANCYQYILRSNIVISLVDHSTGDKDVKELAKAEAKIMRAWDHFILVNTFAKAYNPETAATDGGIAIVSEYDLEATPTKATVAQVYDFIIKDIEDALPYLQEEPVNVYHPSKAFGYALAARVYLFHRDWKKAKDAAEESLKRNNALIDYIALDAVGGPTKVSTYAKGGNPEVLNYAYMGSTSDNPAYTYGMISPELVQLFGDNDERLNLFFKTTGNLEYYFDEGSGAALWNTALTYSKFQYMAVGMRTAEVYLNCAEAKAELGTLTQDDLNKTINKLRARVNMPNLLMATANANPDPYLKEWYPHVESDDNQGIILEIRRERAIELVMEGFRYYDIMRWKEGKIFEKPFLGIYFPGPGEYDLDGDGTNDVYLYLSTDKGNSSCVDQFEIGGELSLDHETSGNLIIHQSIKRVWNEDKDYLYPIPTKDRVLTNGALTQNPGWNDGLIF